MPNPLSYKKKYQKKMPLEIIQILNVMFVNESNFERKIRMGM
jgi:hypothetical protein